MSLATLALESRMDASHSIASTPGWYRRLVERLDPDERLGELLFGLIMVLSFTLGAGIGIDGEGEDTRTLLIAALGCNTAWGVIDAVLHLLNRLSERRRVYRLVKSIQGASSREQALALIARELDDRIPAIVRPEVRAAFDAEVLECIREMKHERPRIGADDAWAGLAVFWLVFLTALPAVVPFLLLRDAQVALRSSNAVLIGLLFYLGWRWAKYTGANPWRMGICFLLLGVALVVVAIQLGG